MSLREKIDKKAGEMREQRKEVFKEIGKGNIAWGRIAKTVITVIVLVLLYLFWNPVLDSLATELKNGTGVIQSQSDALIVANYLLFFLILATVVVEFIPILRDWLNRPKLRLDSFTHATNEVKVGVVKGSFTVHPAPCKVFLVYLNLVNDGRGAATNPEAHFMVFPKKLIKFVHYSMDMAILNKKAHQIAAKPYSSEVADEDALAEEFMSRMLGMDYLHGHGQGVRMVFGFAFQGGKNFYFASEESALPTKLPFTNETQYVAFMGIARNAKPKTIGFNIAFDMPDWNKARFDYKERPIEPLPVGGQSFAK